MIENMGDVLSKGRIRVTNLESGEVVFEDNNVIVQGVKSLFARMMFSISEPKYGVWGLALGAGDASWPSTTQPDPTVTQDHLINTLVRVPLSKALFVDTQGNPVSSGTSRYVDFQTVINSSKVNLSGQNVREMGLIGGGSASLDTDPTADINVYWNETTRDPNAMTLINYKTTPPLVFPEGVSFLISWILSF